MSRRDQIQMSEDEWRKFVRESRTIILCSNGPRGYPHPMPMWFTLDGDVVQMTTYARSQKVLNLERDPRVSMLVEAGEQYQELRGVLMYGRAELVRDVERVIDTLLAASGQGSAADPAVRQAMRANASKRVLIRVRPERVVSWDHAKLGGVY
jgi:PPOX class probable F420-dependent enzyme